ncbi:MAG: DUF1549 domain-containing protein, partial [Planctomycetota bacterium]
MTRRFDALIVCGFFAASAGSAHAEEPIDAVSFNRHVRPLLSDRCYLCHGPDEQAREADLRLDNRDDATDWAIVPGEPAESEVLLRINSSDPDLRMPPPESNKAPLTRAEAELIRRWIEQGAAYERHWALVAPARTESERAAESNRLEHPIDQFIRQQLESQGMAPSPTADPRTLLRRASLDLTGLPPTVEQIDDFLSDHAPDAWSRALERLLDSPAYGERQARFWLDAARYADSNGYQYDFQRDQWAWRDWVIAAFNENAPFDQFTIEQLAGDLLPDATEQQRLATGFNRNHPITVEGGVIDEEYRVEYVIDRTSTVGAVWLGLTLACARCHDHKYDPISQREFYELTAFFNQVPERGFNGFEPRERIPSPFQRRELAAAEDRLNQAKADFDAALRAWNPDQDQYEAELADRLQTLWSAATPLSMVSSGGAELQTLDDGSVFASGKNPASDVYEIVIQSDKPDVRGVRLTALTDDRLPLRGVSRSANGNFVLSEIEVEVAESSTPEDFQPVKLASAIADYSQSGYPVARAIDGKIDG